MKKLIAAAAALIMVFSLCACSSAPAAPSPVSPSGSPASPTNITTPTPDPASPSNFNLPNPMVECASLDELNEALHGNLKSPGAMGVTEQKYYLIGDDIAEYDFTMNGVEYSVRFSPMYDTDISGYYINGQNAFTGMPANGIEYAEDGTAKLARWATIDGQYVLSAKEAQGNFEAVAQEMSNMTNPGMSESELATYYSILAGEYTDTVSQRATMTAEAVGSEGVRLTVHWSSSASEYTEWVMTARTDADGLLCYYDLKEAVITTDADGKETREEVDAATEGHFFDDCGKLLWEGAEEEQCRACVFEKQA